MCVQVWWCIFSYQHTILKLMITLMDRMYVWMYHVRVYLHVHVSCAGMHFSCACITAHFLAHPTSTKAYDTIFTVPMSDPMFIKSDRGTYAEIGNNEGFFKTLFSKC